MVSVKWAVSYSVFIRQVAAQTLGDLVRKLGERVLPEVIPMLEKGLRAESFQEREGVCMEEATLYMPASG